jgi:hypothetical protein
MNGKVRNQAVFYCRKEDAMNARYVIFPALCLVLGWLVMNWSDANPTKPRTPTLTPTPPLTRTPSPTHPLTPPAIPSSTPTLTPTSLPITQTLGALSSPSIVWWRDSGVTVPHDDGVLWAFDSTFLRGSSELGWCSSTSAVSAYSNPLLVTHTLDAQGIPVQFLPLAADELNDPTYCYGLFTRSMVNADDGNALVFYEKVQILRTDILSRTVVGTGLARVATGSTTAIREPSLLFTGTTFAFGSAAIVQGAELYLYGCRWVYYSVRGCALARAPLAQASKRSAYRFWNEYAWVSDIHQAEPILSSAHDPSVSWNPYLGRFIAVTSAYNSNRVLIRSAPRPEGPWEQPVTLFESAPPPIAGRYNTQAREQPALASDSGRSIVVSYHQPSGEGYGFASQIILVKVTFTPNALPFRREVNLSDLPAKRMVALAFGQSNSANHGETRYTPSASVYNFYSGHLYQAQDPLFGATGDMGSVWSRLGDRLITDQTHDAVVFISIGVANTAVADWAPGGAYHPRLLNAIQSAQQQGLTITHILWHQGERDASDGTSTADYRTRFLAMLSAIRQQGVSAPIYVAIASRCGLSAGDPDIQQAQQELVDRAQKIYTGANTDTLDGSHRYDLCHFTTAGLDKHAELWRAQLQVNDLGALSQPASVTARDYGGSARIGNRVLWLFGDTLINPPAADGSSFRSTTAAYGDLTKIRIVTESLDATGAPYQFLPFTADELAYNNNPNYPAERIALWPGAPLDAGDGSALVFYMKLYVHPGELNYDHIGMGLARVVPTNTVAVREPTLLFTATEPLFGMAVLAEGDYVYVYGSCNNGSSYLPLCVARVVPAQVTERAAYQFWNGSQWTSVITEASPVMYWLSDLSVSWNPYLQKFLAVHSQPFTNTVMFRTAPRPEGPWSSATVLFTGMTPATGFYDYAAKEHPEFMADGGRNIIVTYYRPTGTYTGEVRLVEVTLRSNFNYRRYLPVMIR